jgi:hypothetical protein
MSKNYIITFTVEATGVACMPLDMMRYDRVTPRSQEDVGELACIDIPREEGEPPMKVEFVRQSHGDREWSPNVDRWRSFGWKVVKVDAPKSF